MTMHKVHGRQARTQTGASLLFALITLVALALAATALVRSVDTDAWTTVAWRS